MKTLLGPGVSLLQDFRRVSGPARSSAMKLRLKLLPSTGAEQKNTHGRALECEKVHRERMNSLRDEASHEHGASAVLLRLCVEWVWLGLPVGAHEEHRQRELRRVRELTRDKARHRHLDHLDLATSTFI